MGQPQFMPDVYLRYAADFSGDGRSDIWNDRADVLASIANYLKEKGWSPGGPVLEEVRLSGGFDFSLADEIARPLSFWAASGASPVEGGAFTESQQAQFAELWLPAGKDGPALLLFPNFQVIKQYNPSDRYALAVALLARGFEGRPLLQAPWPRDTGYLGREEVLELQQRLTLLGHPSGQPDGMFGANTRRAIRSYQLQRGIPADGYATPTLLASVRTATGAGGPAAESPAASSDPQALKPRPTRSRLLAYAEVKTLQRLLGRLGYRVGRVDGDPGAQTRKAVRELEQRLGYRPTGRVDSFILAQARRLAAR
jgi:membrane-bound lytic murein transglycosylase B